MQIPYTVENHPETGVYNAKLGVWLFLASEVMLFGALFSSYILLRTNANAGHGLDSSLDDRISDERELTQLPPQLVHLEIGVAARRRLRTGPVPDLVEA